MDVNPHEIIHELRTKSCSWYVSIDHDGKFYITWRTIYVFCCLCSSYLYGYMACFRAEGSNHKNNGLQGNIQPLTKDLYQIMAVFEIIFGISMFIEFLVSFEDPRNKGIKIRDFQQITQRYFKGNFMWDIIPLLPF